ncbi:hypothetical protein [Mannheimia haemolytica]|nr:hypothetical protein [Mannheimia haemolytica]
MSVHIKLSCVGDILPIKLNEWTPEHRALHHEISIDILPCLKAGDSY